ncbi:MAG: hypothetical protein QXH81_07335 [Thermofilaceae archaeon]
MEMVTVSVSEVDAAPTGAGAAGPAGAGSAPAAGTPAPRGAGVEQGGYVLFCYIRRVFRDARGYDVTRTLSAIIAPTPQAAHAFKRLLSRLKLTRREIAYYAYRRGVKIALLTCSTGATNTAIESALERSGIPLEKALPLGEVLPRLPEWLKRGLLRTEAWAPGPRPREDAVKEIAPPREWPFSAERAAEHVYRGEWVRVYRFKRRIVVYFSEYDACVSIDRTRPPSELVFSTLSLPKEVQDLLLRRRDEIAEAAPELKPYLELLPLLGG